MLHESMRVACRWAAWGLLVGWAALSAPEAGAEDQVVLNLFVGEQKDFTFPNITKITVGNPKVANVRQTGGDSFIIFGVGRGQTYIKVYCSKKPKVYFKISVTRVDVESILLDLRKLLEGIEGITITALGDLVIVDGRTLTPEDFHRVQKVVSFYPNVKNLVQFHPNARKLVAEQLNLEFQKAGIKEVGASVVGVRIFLEGSVESEEERKKVELITKAVGEEVENLVTVGIKRMILVEVDFVEIKKSGTDHVGVKWPFDITGTASVNLTTNRQLEPESSAETRFTGVIAGQSSFGFGFLFNDGYARVLAQPKLVCASGSEAKFLAGGEVPIVMVTAMAVNVEFKPFGIVLEVKPKADRHGNIDMSVVAEVSDIDRSIGFVGQGLDIPGFVKDRAETNVTVRHGQTIILGNLFHRNEEKTVSKVPLLGHIPILGELFKSRIFKEKKSELCVFVTPRIVNPDTPNIQKWIADIKRRYKQAKGEVGFGIFD